MEDACPTHSLHAVWTVKTALHFVSALTREEHLSVTDRWDVQIRPCLSARVTLLVFATCQRRKVVLILYNHNREGGAKSVPCQLLNGGICMIFLRLFSNFSLDATTTAVGDV